MRIAIIAETFLPAVNGVTHSLQKLLQYLRLRGDEVLVIAPSTTLAEDGDDIDDCVGARVVRLPSVPLAGYADVRIAVGGVGRVRRILADFAPDVVHLASPWELGWRGVRAAHQLGIPMVAVYQTDVPGYMAKYGMPFLESWARQRVTNIHRLTDRTLAPSTSASAQLDALGVPRVRMWGRGVDPVRFHPAKRSAAFRAAVAPDGERLIGYVGRLAAEKQLEHLGAINGIAGTRLVLIGDGPQRGTLEALLPGAHFTGLLTGEALAEAMASLDLFVHPGELETFCQTIQEAMASGVPVVATGRGGPVDLVTPSQNGWLYAPGDLDDLRARVLDLIGDDAKRAAFAATAFGTVQKRTWPVIMEALMGHYRDVIAEHALQSTRSSDAD